jgi:hypothetical protein
MTLSNPLEVLKETACTCDSCKAMCTRPCWPTPSEVRVLIKRGYAKKLCCDYWTENGNDEIEIIGPALKGYEGEKAALYPMSEEGCTFWNNGLCDLHDVGLKPLEGRLANHANVHASENPVALHAAVAQLWDSDEGRAVVAEWKEAVDYVERQESTADYIIGFTKMLKNMIGLPQD